MTLSKSENIQFPASNVKLLLSNSMEAEADDYALTNTYYMYVITISTRPYISSKYRNSGIDLFYVYFCVLFCRRNVVVADANLIICGVM